MTGYTLAVPPPWQRIDLAAPLEPQARALVDRQLAPARGELPPDQLRPMARRLGERLHRDLSEAASSGGVDLYLPIEPLGGVRLNASILVSLVLPGVSEADERSLVMAELVADGAEPVEIAGTVWLRTSRTQVAPADDVVEETPSLVVDYRTPYPPDPQQWVVVSLSSLGDGRPDSPLAELVAELFDAMMTTWRWREHEPPAGSDATPSPDSDGAP